MLLRRMLDQKVGGGDKVALPIELRLPKEPTGLEPVTNPLAWK